MKNSVAPLLLQLPLRRNYRSVANRIESYFAVLPLLDSQSAFWSLFKRCQRHQRKDVSTNSVLTRNGNGSYGTELRQRYNRTAKRQNGNGRVETRHHSVCTTPAQLHSGHCWLLNSYKALITSGISNVRPECGVAPHAVEHVFNCQSHPMQLTVHDLWDNPATVTDLLNLDSWR